MHEINFWKKKYFERGLAKAFFLKCFLSYSQNYICQFKQANSRRRNYSSFIWTWKLRKGREKIQKIEYLRNKKSFLDDIKIIFL